MVVAEIELYKILKTKFTEKEAESIIASIEHKVTGTIESRKSEFATKEDIMKLEAKIAETKVDLIKWVFTFFAAIAVMIIGLYLKK